MSNLHEKTIVRIFTTENNGIQCQTFFKGIAISLFEIIGALEAVKQDFLNLVHKNDMTDDESNNTRKLLDK